MTKVYTRGALFDPRFDSTSRRASRGKMVTGRDFSEVEQGIRAMALGLTPSELSRLIWLCDKEIARLREFVAEQAGNPDNEDDADLAVLLRKARDFLAEGE